jgi:hypothetical protein
MVRCRALVRNDHFDALLRAHKKDRLAIPIQALRATGAPYHGFDLVHPRRLAWFVPSLLASWLERAPGMAPEPTFGANDGEAGHVDKPQRQLAFWGDA